MSASKPTDVIALTLQAGAGNAPAWAALEVVSVAASANGRDLYTVKQPTGTAGKAIVFNGPVVLEASGYGAGSNRSHVRGLSGAATGEVGPVNASWSLSTSAATKTHRVVGGARAGSYLLEKLGGDTTSGDFGIARLYAAMATTDATGLVENYSPILGTATPGSEPASVDNPHDLEGSDGDTVIVTYNGTSWEIAAVLEFSDAEHGFCRPYEDFDSGDATIRPAGYQKVEGVEAPDAGTASVTNPGFSAKTTDTLAVAKRSGTWTVCYVIRGGDNSLRHAIGSLSANMATSDPTGSVTAVVAIEGDTPSPALTSAGNALGLLGYAGQKVLLREDPANTWEIIAVFGTFAAPHGVATLATALSGSSATVTAYRQESGFTAPTPTTVQNPNGLVAAVGIDVDIAWDGTDWNVIDVRGSAIAIAQLNGALSSSGSATIDNFRWLQGNTESPAPTAASNPYGIDGADNDVVLLTNRSGAWVVVYRFGSSSGGAITPCWITSAASVASESGGDITAQAVTVYLDTKGATDADRIAGTTPVTAYWDDPDNAISISSGKARRGMVALTTLGTLDVVFAGCAQRDFTP